MKHAFTETGPIIVSVIIAMIAWLAIAIFIPDSWPVFKANWCMLGWIPTNVITGLIINYYGGFD